MIVCRLTPRPFAIFAAVAITCSAVAPLAARAESHLAAATSAAVVSCADAAKTMSAGMMPTSAMKAHDATDTDATYLAMASEHAQALMNMAKLEMRCGRDAKVKAEAGRDAERIHSVLNTLQIF